jgi:glucose-6-phosphate-specific signal transduction histidine kinase
MGIIHEHEIIKTKLEIQEQALKNIVQEIHDNIGQILSLAKLHLGTLDFSKPEEVAQKTFNSNQLIGKAIKDLRNLAKHLDADHISRVGLLKSIDYELSFMPRERAADPLLTVTGSMGALNKEEELMLFRIVQGGIRYFIERSNTSLVSVQVHCHEAVLVINILDKETQCREEQQDDMLDTHMNMIYSRSALIGANLKISHVHTNETIINITFPFSNH